MIISTNAIAGESLKLPELPALPTLEEQNKDKQKQETNKITANAQQDDAPGFFRKITNFLGITSKKTSTIRAKSSKKNTDDQEELVELEQPPTPSNSAVNNKPLTTAKEELKIPSVPSLDLPALPPSNDTNAQPQPQLPTTDNQNNQSLPKTEITKSTNVQSLPIPTMPKDVQTDQQPAITKPDAGELKVPSLPPIDDLPALPPSNDTNAQPQLPTIDNQNNQSLPKTEITKPTNVQSLPIPTMPKDVQTDQQPAITKPDAGELKVPSLPPIDDLPALPPSNDTNAQPQLPTIDNQNNQSLPKTEITKSTNVQSLPIPTMPKDVQTDQQPATAKPDAGELKIPSVPSLDLPALPQSNDTNAQPQPQLPTTDNQNNQSLPKTEITKSTNVQSLPIPTMPKDVQTDQQPATAKPNAGELKVPSLPPIDDLPSLPQSNDTNAQPQPQLPTTDNQNNQSLPKTEITKSTDVQSLPIPTMPKDVQTDQQPAITKPDAGELKIPSLPPLSDNAAALTAQPPTTEQAKDNPTATTAEPSNVQPPSSSVNTTTTALPATNNIANENDELQSPPPLTTDKSKSARNTILGWFKSKDKEIYQTPAPQQTQLLDKKPIIIEKIVIDDQELTLEQSKFVNDEAMVLLLPNDDIVLGELSEEAKILFMDLYSYSMLLKQIQDKNNRTIQRESIDNFILNYDSYFNATPVLTIDDARNDAFNNLKNNNLFVLRALLDNYHVLQNTDENGNTLLHRTTELDSYSLTKFLLMRGINIQALNTYGQTALTIAEEQQNDDILRLIRKSGAR
ncbi:ankyrin repeat domain-containing protein [Candidatus Trichorickettsia mobilis]|uniref:ankyrin repeat domain-containing protein n=1 Tax=Candidatus Trichorickettsia mobilis TaxID=1346319 RepID=UPI00292CD165|nr:ankyrin repeat domain-containing protein [Candidatus Trichorickettsia mobilis]